MSDEVSREVTPGYAKPPGDELSNAFWSHLAEAEGTQGGAFATRDLCVLVAIAAHQAEVPAELGPLLAAAYAELGLPPEPTRTEVETALARETKDRPLDPALLETLDGFRAGKLEAAVRASRAEARDKLLGGARTPVQAPRVEDRAQLTAARLMHQNTRGKTIIR